jgi:hypothetical protein
MSRSLLPFALSTLLALLALSSACNGTESNRLFGSAATTYALDFTHVDIYKQTKGGVFMAAIVEYVNETKKGREIPVKVVANAPVVEGQDKDLLAEGAIIRVMPDGSQFKNIEQGHINFDSLPDAGADASGAFYITFIGGSTLNGEFSAKVQALEN